MHEIRFRTPAPLHRALSLAAAKRGVATAALVSMAVYEYLHAHGEFASTLEGANQTVPKTTVLDAWMDDEDDEPLNVGS